VLFLFLTLEFFFLLTPEFFLFFLTPELFLPVILVVVPS